MATLRAFRVGSPSLLGLALAWLLPAASFAALDPERLTSTVRSGPLEMVVALEDSSYVQGQRTAVLICVTNRGKKTVPYVPQPFPDGSELSVRFWKIGPGGAWFAMRKGYYSCPVAIRPYAVPPIEPLEPGGSTCYSTDLNTGYGANVAQKQRVSPRADPTWAFHNSRLSAGRYALQLGYHVEETGRPEPFLLESDTLFFAVTSAPDPAERELLSRYGTAVDSEPFRKRQEVASRWLPRFQNSRFFQTVFLDAGRFANAIPPERLFAWLDPYGTRATSRAMLLDLLFRISALSFQRDPASLSAFARGDLAKRVVQDWSSRPGRYHVRDSVYTERKKELLRGWPPYGTYRENASDDAR